MSKKRRSQRARSNFKRIAGKALQQSRRRMSKRAQIAKQAAQQAKRRRARSNFKRLGRKAKNVGMAQAGFTDALLS